MLQKRNILDKIVKKNYNNELEEVLETKHFDEIVQSTLLGIMYKIKKGDRFLCLEDYVMDDERIAYSKGKIYKSDLDGRITDNEFDVHHEMECQNDFFEYFELVVSDLKLVNKSKLEEAIYSLDEDDLCNDNIIIDLEDLF